MPHIQKENLLTLFVHVTDQFFIQHGVELLKPAIDVKFISLFTSIDFINNKFIHLSEWRISDHSLAGTLYSH